MVGFNIFDFIFFIDMQVGYRYIDRFKIDGVIDR